jgi:succinate dehydrogenase/fumarate reductase flavoprotein subunit
VPRAKKDNRPPSSIPEKERLYFLEEKYPAYGNLVPRDIATREIFQVCLDGMGVNGENQVYLDLTHIPAEKLEQKLGAILEIYEMFVGDDPKHVQRNGANGSRLYEDETKRQQEINDALIKQSGDENQYKLHDEMGKWMTDNVTVVRYNDRLKATDEKLLELMDRYRRISINDSNLWATMALPHARHLDNMLELARVITLGALNRNESRGAHYKPDFPNRDDANWLKTTIAEYSGEGPVFSYDNVDISLIEPRKRDYSHEKKETTTEKGGAPQIPTSEMQQKPASLSGPAGDVKVN